MSIRDRMRPPLRREMAPLSRQGMMPPYFLNSVKANNLIQVPPPQRPTEALARLHLGKLRQLPGVHPIHKMTAVRLTLWMLRVQAL